MDLKGIVRVGNIYQKFEAMCLEVEEAMCQETAKYVESQVQTMSASIKRFYSDVMQDLLPPSSTDPVKVAAADLLLNPYTDFEIHKKPKTSIKEDTKKIVCVKRVSEEDNSPPSEKSSSCDEVSKDQPTASSIGEISEKNEAACEQIAMISPQASVEVVGCDSRVEEEWRIGNCILDAGVCIDEASIASPASGAIVLVESCAKRGKYLSYVSSSKNLTPEFTDKCGDSGLVSQIDSYTSGGAQYGQSTDEEIFVFHTGGPGDCNLNMIDKNDTTESRFETIGQDSKSKLEETCVLVDGDDFCPVARKEGKNRSYKKKIREAFSLKMKSARKQEYQRLAAQYGNVDTQSNVKSVEAVMPTLATNSNSMKLPTQDFLESEWELL